MQTIMIVEDDPDIRDGVRILLSGEEIGRASWRERVCLYV